MNNIKLKSTQSEHGFSSIDLAEDSSTLGLFAMVFNDPDGSKGNRLTMCWNEHDELVRQRDELVATLEELRALVWGECPALLDDDSYGDAMLDAKICALLAKIGGEDK